MNEYVYNGEREREIRTLGTLDKTIIHQDTLKFTGTNSNLPQGIETRNWNPYKQKNHYQSPIFRRLQSSS